MQQLVIATKSESILSIGQVEVPAVLQYAGRDVLKAFATFFTDQIRNKNTRQAYLRNATRFFEWCEIKGVFHGVESAWNSGRNRRFGWVHL